MMVNKNIFFNNAASFIKILSHQSQMAIDIVFKTVILNITKGQSVLISQAKISTSYYVHKLLGCVVMDIKINNL